MFRYGVAFEPVESATQRAHDLARGQPAGRQRAGRSRPALEWTWLGRLALRSGYNFNADDLKFSARRRRRPREVGGVRRPARLRVHRRRVRWAAVNRLTLGVRF